MRLVGLEPTTYGLKAAVRPRRKLKPFAVSPYLSVPYATVFLAQETDKTPEKPPLRLSDNRPLALRVCDTCATRKRVYNDNPGQSRYLHVYPAGSRQARPAGFLAGPTARYGKRHVK